MFVSPKTTVLDPQGQAIRGALNGLGALLDYRGAVQGKKVFEVELNGASREAAAIEMDQIGARPAFKSCD